MSERDAVLEIHNQSTGGIIAGIVRPTIEAGGTPMDVMVLLESVVAGVLTIIVKQESDNMILNTFADRVRERMTTLRKHDLL